MSVKYKTNLEELDTKENKTIVVDDGREEVIWEQNKAIRNQPKVIEAGDFIINRYDCFDAECKTKAIEDTKKFLLKFREYLEKPKRKPRFEKKVSECVEAIFQTDTDKAAVINLLVETFGTTKQKLAFAAKGK